MASRAHSEESHYELVMALLPGGGAPPPPPPPHTHTCRPEPSKSYRGDTTLEYNKKAAIHPKNPLDSNRIITRSGDRFFCFVCLVAQFWENMLFQYLSANPFGLATAENSYFVKLHIFQNLKWADVCGIGYHHSQKRTGVTSVTVLGTQRKLMRFITSLWKEAFRNKSTILYIYIHGIVCARVFEMRQMKHWFRKDKKWSLQWVSLSKRQCLIEEHQNLK